MLVLDISHIPRLWDLAETPDQSTHSLVSQLRTSLVVFWMPRPCLKVTTLHALFSFFCNRAFPISSRGRWRLSTTRPPSWTHSWLQFLVSSSVPSLKTLIRVYSTNSRATNTVRRGRPRTIRHGLLLSQEAPKPSHTARCLERGRLQVVIGGINFRGWWLKWDNNKQLNITKSFIFLLALCPCIFLVYYTSPLSLLSTFHIALLRGMQDSSKYHLRYIMLCLSRHGLSWIRTRFAQGFSVEICWKDCRGDNAKYIVSSTVC